jgi:hypothetical protein
MTSTTPRSNSTSGTPSSLSSSSPPSQSPNFRNQPIPPLSPNPQPTTVSSNSTVVTMNNNRTPDMMPPEGTKSAPTKFKGDPDEVKPFLRRFNQLCSAYNVTEDDRCERILEYVCHTVKRFIEGLTSYRAINWTQLQKDILEFYDADLSETRYKVHNLRDLVKQWRNTPINDLAGWKKYQRKFITIAGWLRDKGSITREEEATYFWHGIYKRLRHKVEARLIAKSPKPDLTKAFPIRDIKEIADGIFERNRFDYNLVDSDSDVPEFGNISDSEDSDSGDSSDNEREESDDEEEFQLKAIKRKRALKKTNKKAERVKDKHSKRTETKKTARKTTDKKEKNTHDEVEQMIDQLGKMNISDPVYARTYYKAIKMDPDVVRCVPAPNIQAPRAPFRNSYNNAPSSRPVVQSTFNAPMTPQGPLKCFGCGEAGHSIKNCAQISDMINKGVLTRNSFGRLRDKNGQFIPRNAEESFVDAVKRLSEGLSHYIALNSPNSENSCSEYYITDSDRNEYDSDMDNDAHVMAAERVPKKTTTARREVLDGVYMPPPSHSKGKENKVPKGPNKTEPFKVRTGGPIEIIRNDSSSPEPFVPQQVPVDVRTPRIIRDDVVMGDSTNQPKQKSDPRSKPRIYGEDNRQVNPKPKPVARQSELTSTVENTQIVKHILDAPVTLKIREILGSSRELTDQLAHMMKRKNVKSNETPAHVNLNSAFLPFSDKADLIVVPLQIGNRDILAIVDTGSQLNIVKRKIFDTYLTHLPMDPSKTLTMNDANGGSGLLKGYVSNVQLTCGSVTTAGNFYMGDSVPFDLLLGRPWQRDNLVSIDERLQGTYLIFRNIGEPEVKFELRVQRIKDYKSIYNFCAVEQPAETLETTENINYSEEIQIKTYPSQNRTYLAEMGNSGTDSDSDANPDPDHVLGITMHADMELGPSHDVLTACEHYTIKSVPQDENSKPQDPESSAQEQEHDARMEHPHLDTNSHALETFRAETTPIKYSVNLEPLQFLSLAIIIAFIIGPITIYSIVHSILNKVQAQWKKIYKKARADEYFERNGLQSQQSQTNPEMGTPATSTVTHNATLPSSTPFPLHLPLVYVPTNHPVPAPDTRFKYSTSNIDIERHKSLVNRAITLLPHDPQYHAAVISTPISIRFPPSTEHDDPLVEHGVFIDASFIQISPDTEPHPAVRSGHLFYSFFPQPFVGVDKIVRACSLADCECIQDTHQADRKITDPFPAPPAPDTNPVHPTSTLPIVRTTGSFNDGPSTLRVPTFHANQSKFERIQPTLSARPSTPISPDDDIPSNNAHIFLFTTSHTTSTDHESVTNELGKRKREESLPTSTSTSTRTNAGSPPPLISVPFPTPTHPPTPLRPTVPPHDEQKAQKTKFNYVKKASWAGMGLDDDEDEVGDDNEIDELYEAVSERLARMQITDELTRHMPEETPAYRHYVPMQDPHRSGPPVLPASNDRRVKYYEMKTTESPTDSFNDAQSTVLRQHGVTIFHPPPPTLPILIPPRGLHVPPLNPGNYPIRLHTEVIYHGTVDNHPLKHRELTLMCDADMLMSRDYSTDEREMANKFIAAAIAIAKQDEPAVGHMYSPEKSLFIARLANEPERPRLANLPALSSPQLIRMDEDPYIIDAYRCYIHNPSLLDAPHFEDVKRDIRQFLGQPSTPKDDPDHPHPQHDIDDDDDEDGDDSAYWPPSCDSKMLDNTWVPRIRTLRAIRRLINEGIRFLAKLLLTQKWRDRVDCLMNDTRHYFFYHCHIFRYIDNSRQVLYQGFYQRCVHLDYSQPTPKERLPLTPLNPLITADEDEFLAQAANIFEINQLTDLVNAIRRFRGQFLPHEDDARALLAAMYLDPDSYMDNHGARRAIIWRDSDL